MGKAGRVLAGKYRLERLLGRGGMGSVWLARHQQLDCAVAVKLLENRRPDCPEVRARFEREAQLLAALDHPRIAAIHGVDTDGDTRFLVVELVDDDTLADRMVVSG